MILERKIRKQNTGCSKKKKIYIYIYIYILTANNSLILQSFSGLTDLK